MADYLRILWQNPRPREPAEVFYEVQDDRAVTRVIEVFDNGTSIADSLQIAARREPALSNNACLCDGKFPHKDDYDAIFKTTDTSYKSIPKSRFDALFVRSNIKS